ncbi:hypothetical protein KEM55_006568 [Ascosphaera atra]|nr:hypothetical protein KEM55_006568 [Ascosphaera atra]
MDESDEELYGPSESTTRQPENHAAATADAANAGNAEQQKDTEMQGAGGEEEEEYEEVEEDEDELNIITEASPETIANMYVQPTSGL